MYVEYASYELNTEVTAVVARKAFASALFMAHTIMRRFSWLPSVQVQP